MYSFKEFNEALAATVPATLAMFEKSAIAKGVEGFTSTEISAAIAAHSLHLSAQKTPKQSNSGRGFSLSDTGGEGGARNGRNSIEAICVIYAIYGNIAAVPANFKTTLYANFSKLAIAKKAAANLLEIYAEKINALGGGGTAANCIDRLGNVNSSSHNTFCKSEKMNNLLNFALNLGVNIEQVQSAFNGAIFDKNVLPVAASNGLPVEKIEKLASKGIQAAEIADYLSLPVEKVQSYFEGKKAQTEKEAAIMAKVSKLVAKGIEAAEIADYLSLPVEIVAAAIEAAASEAESKEAAASKEAESKEAAASKEAESKEAAASEAESKEAAASKEAESKEAAAIEATKSKEAANKTAWQDAAKSGQFNNKNRR